MRTKGVVVGVGAGVVLAIAVAREIVADGIGFVVVSGGSVRGGEIEAISVATVSLGGCVGVPVVSVVL